MQYIEQEQSRKEAPGQIEGRGLVWGRHFRDILSKERIWPFGSLPAAFKRAC